MEVEDDSATDGNLVSFRSEIHPIILDSMGDSLVSFDFFQSAHSARKA